MADVKQAAVGVDVSVLLSVRKASDLETHVRSVEVDGVQVMELRDFIPSLGEYGRGYWVPADPVVISQIARALLLSGMPTVV